MWCKQNEGGVRTFQNEDTTINRIKSRVRNLYLSPLSIWPDSCILEWCELVAATWCSMKCRAAEKGMFLEGAEHRIACMTQQQTGLERSRCSYQTHCSILSQLFVRLLDRKRHHGIACSRCGLWQPHYVTCIPNRNYICVCVCVCVCVCMCVCVCVCVCVCEDFPTTNKLHPPAIELVAQVFT